MVTIAVNGHPLPAAAITRHGRVLLPMRVTFAALGATVRYDPHGRVVVARSPAHSVRLTIGSQTARVDGYAVPLDVPAAIAGSTAYVPVRFAAQALGASVGYDAQAALVTIAAANYRTPRAKSQVAAREPAPDAQIPTAYPNITASIVGAGALRDKISLSVDGQDVSTLASFDGNTITYLPRTAMPAGSHTVAFDGTTIDGTPFESQWSFTTTATPPADQSAMPADYGYQFYVNGPGWYHYGDWMHFTLLAPPGGSAYLQLCGLGYQYAFWNGGNGNQYFADVPAPYGYWLSQCPVEAFYTAWNGQQYIVPLPVYVAIYTIPQPYPFIAGPGQVWPTPAPPARFAPLPPDRRRTEPVGIPLGPRSVEKPVTMKPLAPKPVLGKPIVSKPIVIKPAAPPVSQPKAAVQPPPPPAKPAVPSPHST